MDDHARAAAGKPSRGDTAQVPTAGQVVPRTMPAVVVLIIAMPVALWWLQGTLSGELRTPWWPALLIGLLVLFHVLARLIRAPRSRSPQVSAERAHSALVSASRTGAGPSEQQVRAAAGVTACRRVEAAVHAVASTVGVLFASLLVPQPSRTAFAVSAAGLAVIHLVRARHSWACLRALHGGCHIG